MCLPVAAVAAIVAVAGAAVSQFSQYKSAKVQAKAINNQLEVTAEETRDKATGELFDQMRATRREQARIRAAAGEAGLSTSSGNIEALLGDSAMQGGLSGERTLANMESRMASNKAEATSMMSRIQKPNALSAGLNIALAGASAYTGAGGKFSGPNPMGS